MKSIGDYPPCVLHNHNAKGDGDFANDANDFLRTEKQMSTEKRNEEKEKEKKSTRELVTWTPIVMETTQEVTEKERHLVWGANGRQKTSKIKKHFHHHRCMSYPTEEETKDECAQTALCLAATEKKCEER